MYKYIPINRKISWADLIVLAFVALFIYAFMGVASHWTNQFTPETQIDLSTRSLPKYAFFSFVRGLSGYLLSLGFTFVYGYIAAKLKRSEVVLIPLLDILQSIPVFGFLPGLVLGMMALFPNSNIGLEIACIVMIATGQAWNMTFSFYYSLKNVPQELQEAGTVMRLTWFQRLMKIEMPFAAVGLAWNSLMSMAGGWFFLTVCESFQLENKSFHVPGIGSYMAIAIERGDRHAMIYGVIAMCMVILFVDVVIWRPVLAWIQKFQMENTENQTEAEDTPFVTNILRNSVLIDWISDLQSRIRRERKVRVAKRRFLRGRRSASKVGAVVPLDSANDSIQQGALKPLPIVFDEGWEKLTFYWKRNSDKVLDFATRLITPFTILLLLFAGTRVWELIRTLKTSDWMYILRSLGFSGVRVFVAVFLSTIWTVPFGIIVGLSPRLTRLFQPVVQVAASFPAPMVYPIVLTVLFKLGISMNWAAMFLMLFGVQWYVLFNVLAGATSVSRNLRDSMTLMRVSKKSFWWNLYIPSIFPHIANGWVTAAGGAWNASIVAEFIQYNGETLTAPGIGSLIWKSTISGDFPRLAASILAMVLTVVILNRVLWNRICEFAEHRYRN